MSAALNTHTRADSSTQSGLTLQDLSLGSFGSISTPAKLRVPSTSSGTTAASSAPLGTPSPPSLHVTRRNKLDNDAGTPLSKRLASFSRHVEDDYEDGDDVLDTPARENKGGDLTTPATNRLSSKRKSSNANNAKGSSNLTLRDQEKVCVHFNVMKLRLFLSADIHTFPYTSISMHSRRKTSISSLKFTFWRSGLRSSLLIRLMPH